MALPLSLSSHDRVRDQGTAQGQIQYQASCDGLSGSNPSKTVPSNIVGKLPPTSVLLGISKVLGFNITVVFIAIDVLQHIRKRERT